MKMASRTCTHEVHKDALIEHLKELCDEIEEFLLSKDGMEKSRPKSDYWENWETIASQCIAFGERVKYLREV
ncbi:MAG TPA: hypothetical protein PKJ51_04445 [Methanothrix sp.]|nr:hypothetical protein [Methanothrix sp.]